MYLDLRSKLEMYKNGNVQRYAAMRKRGRDIHELVEGTVCTNEDGCFFVMENKYHLAYLYGGYSLGSALDIDARLLKLMGCRFEDSIGIREFLFLDTETTGLSGGTGTVVFLAGTGFFDGDSFVLRQYFMRDYDEEPAMLSALNGLISGYKGLVTFNGKAFDWNILLNRFTFNRIKPALMNPIHLDLLFPARRIWRAKLESCRLSSLEENVLGECRVDDIPGAMIPSVYFRYLEDRDATDIKRVISHNEADILSMVALMVKISSLLENPVEEADDELELMGVGRIFEDVDEHEAMVDCLERCLKSDILPVREAAGRKLSGIYKRKGDFRKAVAHWEKMLADSGAFNVFPMVELAKYYEHKEKDILKALKIVDDAIRLSSQAGHLNGAWRRELLKRYERLKRKSRGKT